MSLTVSCFIIKVNMEYNSVKENSSIIESSMMFENLFLNNISIRKKSEEFSVHENIIEKSIIELHEL